MEHFAGPPKGLSRYLAQKASYQQWKPAINIQHQIHSEHLDKDGSVNGPYCQIRPNLYYL